MARVFVTGVNRGIGKALHELAVNQGHEVIGTTRSGENGTIVLPLDDPGAIGGRLRDVGPVDMLINNAGTIGPDRQSPLDMDFEGFARTFAVNTLAPLAVAQALLPQLRAGNDPRIVTISSQMSFMGYRKADRIAYRASKAAVNKVMQGLATMLEPEGIPVVLVDPGWVRTDMGGPSATEAPEDVAAGILAIAARITPVDTGKFFRFSGEERAF